MKRLTEEMQVGPFSALKDKADSAPGAFGTYNCFYSHMVAVTRLKQYEDAMPLERARELAQAEKDGRLVVLPCKAGDMLYEVDLPKYGVITCEVFYIGTYNGPAAYGRGNPMVSAVSVGVEVVEGYGKGSGYAFEAEDFGKTVFLTREEAEAALKKMEDEICTATGDPCCQCQPGPCSSRQLGEEADNEAD